MLNNRALAASSSTPKLYVEDVFSTYLYPGASGAQTIQNEIDLSGKGGLVWFKNRTRLEPHALFDSARANAYLSSNTTGVQTSNSGVVFNSNGFNLNLVSDLYNNSYLNQTYTSWTFRKAAKFFDVVTWTAVGTSGNRRISHNLGSVPGCIIVKVTNAADSWYVYHRSEGRSKFLKLNLTDASASQPDAWGTSDPTSTDFGFAENVFTVPGWTYVAYLFAHDAGGFGDSGNDSIIKCGSFTHGSDTELENLGWEPQWVLIKNTSTGDWRLYDTLRGASTNSSQVLLANSATAEVQNNASSAACIVPRATGFNHVQFSFETFIYIAIRRGPMKTPTDATKVFSAITATGGSGTTRTVGFPADLYLATRRAEAFGFFSQDRLRGFEESDTTGKPILYTASTAAEVSNQNPFAYQIWNTSARDGSQGLGSSNLWYYLRRAPGFFDVVAYSGGGTSKNHNLGVKPELAFIKVRSTSFRNWIAAIQGGTGGYLNTSDPINASNLFVDLSNATSTTFPINGNPEVGQSGQTYIAYLFATCPGVSKVGSYTGTGNSTLNVNCGFTTGARFVLIKRTDSAGDWYVWDSARGLTVSTAPYLLFNSTATEVTGTTYINSISTGFGVSAGSPEIPVNITGASYIYLAIA